MFLACLFGEFPGVLILCCAFVADVTRGENAKSRMTRMALVDCANNLASLPAGLLAGQLLKHLGFTAVFGFTIILGILILLYVLFILPDTDNEKSPIEKSIKVTTLPKTTNVFFENRSYVDDTRDNEKATSKNEISPEEFTSQNIDKKPENFPDEEKNVAQKPIDWELIKPHKQIYKVYKLLSCKERRHLILPPLLAFTFIIYALVGELTITTLYLKSNPLAFTPDVIGYYFATQAVIRSVGLLLITQFAHRVLKASDINILLFGIITQIACYVSIGVSRNTLSIFLANVAGFGIPSALSLSRSYTSKQVPAHQMGTLLSAFASMDSITGTVNLITIEVYNATLEHYNGAVFLFLAGCSLVAFCVTITNKIYLRRRNGDNGKWRKSTACQ